MSPGLREPAELTLDVLRRQPIPGLEAQGDKEERGRVLVVGGSDEVPGAALLAGVAALRVGAGKLQMAVPRAFVPAIGVSIPEARVIGIDLAGNADQVISTLVERARDCRAVLVGPGMMAGEAVERLTRALLAGAAEPGFVLDAGAMNSLTGAGAGVVGREVGLVITPHPGEMAHLLGRDVEEITADPMRVAAQAAERFGVVVALKSARTHIASPNGDAYYLDEGRIGLATSGSGDVLAGVIAGLIARGSHPLAAALWGVYLHREAGAVLARNIGPLGYLARELLDQLPRVLARGCEELPTPDQSRTGS